MKVKWTLDPSHSEMNFRVKHMMIANVTGSVGQFNVEAVSDDDHLSNADVKVEAQLESISTGDPKRDAHLKSADFLTRHNFQL